jgi:hypothetical protein
MRNVTFAAIAAVVLVTTGIAHAGDQASRGQPPAAIGACTMALPALHATVEVQIANAADFCEFVSQGLADDVFHSRVLVTPDQLWHYAGAPVSCRLRYRLTAYRMTIRNSAPVCRFLTLPSASWRREPATAPLEFAS